MPLSDAERRTTAGSPSRRVVLASGLAGLAGLAALAAGCAPPPNPPAVLRHPPLTPHPDQPAFDQAMLAVEARFGGQVGVSAVDTGSATVVGHRGGERFLMCSTIKVPVVAAVLARQRTDADLLGRRLFWNRTDLLANSPATTAALPHGATVAELCRAALTLSDNTAERVLSTQVVGGPPGVTAFLSGLGDTTTRADRDEPDLNSAAGDLDTTTPDAFAATLRAVTLGTALDDHQRDQLLAWMTANTTGTGQIRAGVPANYPVADKTGSGFRGEANDVAVVRPPGRAPLVMAIFTRPTDPGNGTGRSTIAAVASRVGAVFGLPTG